MEFKNHFEATEGQHAGESRAIFIRAYLDARNEVTGNALGRLKPLHDFTPLFISWGYLHVNNQGLRWLHRDIAGGFDNITQEMTHIFKALRISQALYDLEIQAMPPADQVTRLEPVIRNLEAMQAPIALAERYCEIAKENLAPDVEVINSLNASYKVVSLSASRIRIRAIKEDDKNMSSVYRRMLTQIRTDSTEWLVRRPLHDRISQFQQSVSAKNPGVQP